ncbi:DUF998 domain-containing protein [Candidatus Bipolaricaulota bacterium]|nr:DUF998 domain-containing protein [Candidatus Bipolaricaulota bacterium]
MARDSKRLPSYDSEISKWFFCVSILIPVSLILALLFFREPFHFLENAFSELGESVTRTGQPNGPSRWVFSFGWIVCGLLMARIAMRYSHQRRLRKAQLKKWLAWAGSLGFFVAITPNDINHVLHSVGMGLVVAVTFFFGIVFLVELRVAMPQITFYASMIVLLTSVLTYAAAFFMDLAMKQVAQKACVLGLLFAVEKASTVAPEGFEWRTALQAIRNRY